MNIQFHIGSNHSESNQSTKRKRSLKKLTIQEKNINSVKTKLERENKLLDYCVDVDPLYLRYKMLNKTYACFPTLFKPSQNGEITMLIPNVQIPFMRIGSKTYVEWYIYLKEMELDWTIAIYGSQYVSYANYIFCMNQRTRWAFKRLHLVWLNKRCERKKIGLDKDILTLEPIQEKNMICFQCCNSRSIYYFGANTLLKSICSNLEMQVAALPKPTVPRNPYTNMPFGYGQLLSIYNKCMEWCCKRSIHFPILFSMYREHKFRIHPLLRLHSLYMDRSAIQNYIKNEDMDNEFFLETVNDFFIKHKHFFVFKNINLTYLKPNFFRKWIEVSPKNHLLKRWKLLIGDYWIFEQTGIYPRENWLSTASILLEMETLYKVSEKYLKKLICRRKKPVQPILASGIPTTVGQDS